MSNKPKQAQDYDELTRTVYDRQIRLWGHETQRRLGGLTVTIIGRIRTLAYECVKNLALAGVGRICFLNTETSITKNNHEIEWIRKQIEKLNPAVKFNAILESSADERVPTLTSVLAREAADKMQIFLFTDLSLENLKRFSAIAKQHKVAMIDARVAGLCGMAVFETKHFNLDFDERKKAKTTKSTIYEMITNCKISTGRKAAGLSTKVKSSYSHLAAFMAVLLSSEQNSQGCDLKSVLRRFIDSDTLNPALLNNEESLASLLSVFSPEAPDFLPISSVVAGFVVSEITRLIRNKLYVHIDNAAFYTSEYLNGMVFQFLEEESYCFKLSR